MGVGLAPTGGFLWSFWSSINAYLLGWEKGVGVRMKYQFSDVYSDKNSLAIIYMCLKMHCLKYVINFILFYSCGPGVAI